MMTLSALSLVRQGNSHYMDALQYYDQALPSLQSSLQNCEDVLSDGLFLTHFLLLIYQVSFTPSRKRTCVLTQVDYIRKTQQRVESLVAPHVPATATHSAKAVGR
jgi:hypothetical protein